MRISDDRHDHDQPQGELDRTTHEINSLKAEIDRQDEQKIRREIATGALQGLLTLNPDIPGVLSNPKLIASALGESAVLFADALIAALEKSK